MWNYQELHNNNKTLNKWEIQCNYGSEILESEWINEDEFTRVSGYKREWGK